MSFILDALRKSENERQNQSDAEFAAVPSGTDNPSPPRWLWVLGALLVVNVVVVTGLLLRPSAPASDATAPQTLSETVPETAPETIAAAVPDPVPEQSFAERVDAARQNQTVRTTPAPEPAVARGAPAPEPAYAAPAESDNPLLLPSIQEVVANGTLQLPPMHIDIHVYSDSPGDRFVFINMNKYREGEQLDEGPTVQEITREGVVLADRGTEFFLSRD